MNMEDNITSDKVVEDLFANFKAIDKKLDGEDLYWIAVETGVWMGETA